ncbi:MAG: TrkA C-terminal domain-containing protein, partial [Eubacteriales bacterium]
PITGSILIMEMTGSIEHLLPLIMVSMFAYIVSDILKCRPIYDDLYVLMIAGTKKKSKKKYKKKYYPDQIIDKEKNIVDIPKIENSKNTKMQMIIESTDDVILDKNEKVEFVSSKKSKTNSENKRKTIIEQIVCMGSRIEEKRVKDINWPQGCLIVSIRNGEEDVIPEGNTIIMTGDNLYVLVDQDEEYEMKVMLEELCGERYGQKIY